MVRFLAPSSVRFLDRVAISESGRRPGRARLTGHRRMVVSAGGAECRPASAADPQRGLMRNVIIMMSVAMVAVVALAGSEPSGRSTASRGSGTLAERQRQLTQLTRIKIGGTTIGDTGTEAGNLGAFWNTAGREPGSTPDSSGAGAFGTWGVESVEPAGEAYADGKKEAEDAFVAARGGAAGDDEDGEGRGDAGSASGDAGDPWLAGDADSGGASGDHGGYLGAGKSGNTEAHPDYGPNLDGSRYDNGCDRAVTAGCVGVITWATGAGKSGNRDLGLADEPDNNNKDPAVENVHQVEPFEDIDEVLKDPAATKDPLAHSPYRGPTSSQTKASAYYGESLLRALTHQHVTHAPAPVEDTKFWEGLGTEPDDTDYTSNAWSSEMPAKALDPDAPSPEEADKDKEEPGAETWSWEKLAKKIRSVNADTHRDKMLSKTDNEVRKLFGRQAVAAKKQALKRLEKRASHYERGRQGEQPAFKMLESLAKKLYIFYGAHHQDNTAAVAQSLQAKENNLEGELKREKQILLKGMMKATSTTMLATRSARARGAGLEELAQVSL